jgi:hypothetical protein
MTGTERLTERAISFAITEADEDLAVARLDFLAQGDHAALDAAIDACLVKGLGGTLPRVVAAWQGHQPRMMRARRPRTSRLRAATMGP